MAGLSFVLRFVGFFLFSEWKVNLFVVMKMDDMTQSAHEKCRYDVNNQQDGVWRFAEDSLQNINRYACHGKQQDFFS